MGLLNLFAAANRGNDTNRNSFGGVIYDDQRLSRAKGWEKDPEELPKKVRWSKVTRAVFIMFLNIFFGVLAGVIYRELELPAELQGRRERALVISRLGGNASMPAADWDLLVGVLGYSAEALQSDVDAVASGTLHEQDADWDLAGSMFFAFTIATSIGYGTFAPQTSGGRLFTIFYALVAIPLMLSAFTNLTALFLQRLASKVSGPKRDLPLKVFRMMDKDGSGTLTKNELIRGLELLGLGDYSSGATVEKRKHFEDIFRGIDKDGSGQIELHEFRMFLQKLVPDDDEVLVLVDVVTRSYVALVAIACFLVFVLLSTGAFVFLKRAESWQFLDSMYFTIITFLTIGLGDLAPDPHPLIFTVAWVFFTFFGLGFTTAMVQALSDPQLNIRASMRGLCPNWCTGALSKEEIQNVRKSQVPLARDSSSSTASIGSFIEKSIKVLDQFGLHKTSSRSVLDEATAAPVRSKTVPTRLFAEKKSATPLRVFDDESGALTEADAAQGAEGGEHADQPKKVVVFSEGEPPEAAEAPRPVAPVVGAAHQQQQASGIIPAMPLRAAEGRESDGGLRAHRLTPPSTLDNRPSGGAEALSSTEPTQLRNFEC